MPSELTAGQVHGMPQVNDDVARCSGEYADAVRQLQIRQLL